MSDHRWYGGYVGGSRWATGVLSGEKGWYFRKSGSRWSQQEERRLSKDLKERE